MPRKYFGFFILILLTGILIQVPLSSNASELSIQSDNQKINEKNFVGQSDVQNQRKNFFISLALTLPIIFLLWYQRRLFLTILVLLMSTYLYEYQVESIVHTEELEANNRILQNHLASVSNKLKSSIQTNLSSIAGFAAYISAMPELSGDDFNRYATALFRKHNISVNFAAAKDLVINFVYPLAGNEQLVGMDYKKQLDQIDKIMQVIETREIQLVGPITLVQGGVAFIGRAPVFTNDNKLWGIISSALRANLLFEEAGLNSDGRDFEIAIRSYDSLGQKSLMVYGNEKIMADEKSIQTSIGVGGGSWRLAAIDTQPRSEISANIFSLRLYFIVASILLSLLCWYRLKQEAKREKLEEELRNDNSLFKSISEVARVGGWKIASDLKLQSRTQQSSLRISEWIGFQPESLLDYKPILSADDYALVESKVARAFQDGNSFDIEVELRVKDMNPLWLRIKSDGQTSKNKSFLMGTMQDVTDKVLSAKLIEHQATFDALTGLPNRLFYRDRLDQAIENAQRSQQKIAVLFVDLDRFKPVNDNYGHQMGDKLLIEAASRIKKSIRSSDTVSRLSGDEFAVILNNIPKYNQVLKIAEEIQRKIQQPFQIEQKSIHLSSSIGIALYPNDASTADELLRKADQAMYEVKANGRSGCQFYTKRMQQKLEYRHDLLSELIVAIEQRRLEPYYQPIIDLSTNKISKCEALARWKNKNGEYVPPVDFISLAEESGLINKIDLFMLEQSCASLVSLNQPVELSINISPRLFQTKDHALDDWMSSIRKLNQSTKITVEITERLLTEDSDKALNILNQLREMGVKIAIDDFGTGYSSLSYLIKYHVDIIKIDRSFIKGIGKDSSAEALIETILAMAERLDLKVVAEGIETQGQLDYLVKNKCDFGQGYFLGKPMDKNIFSAFVDKHYFF